MLLRFAKKFGYGDRLNIVSLGQGQGPYAKQLIENGTKTGNIILSSNFDLNANRSFPFFRRLGGAPELHVSEELDA